MSAGEPRTGSQAREKLPHPEAKGHGRGKAAALASVRRPAPQAGGTGLDPPAPRRSFLLSGPSLAGQPEGGEAPGGVRQSQKVGALWARLSSSPGLTCQADYLRGRLIGEAGCNNNRFV